MRLFKQKRLYGGGKKLAPAVTRSYPSKAGAAAASLRSEIHCHDSAELLSFKYDGVVYTVEDFVSQRLTSWGENHHLFVTTKNQHLFMFSLVNGVLSAPEGVDEVQQRPVEDALLVRIQQYEYMGLTIRNSELSSTSSVRRMTNYYHRAGEKAGVYEIVVLPEDGRAAVDTVVFGVDRRVGQLHLSAPGSGHPISNVRITARSRSA